MYYTITPNHKLASYEQTNEHSYKVICTRNTRHGCVYSALARLGNDSQFRAQNSYLKLAGHIIFEMITLLLQIVHVSPTTNAQ